MAKYIIRKEYDIWLEGPTWRVYRKLFGVLWYVRGTSSSTSAAVCKERLIKLKQKHKVKKPKIVDTVIL